YPTLVTPAKAGVQGNCSFTPPGGKGEGFARDSTLENRFGARAAGEIRAYRREPPLPAPPTRSGECGAKSNRETLAFVASGMGWRAKRRPIGHRDGLAPVIVGDEHDGHPAVRWRTVHPRSCDRATRSR